MTTSTYAAWVSWLEAFRRGEDPPTDWLRVIGPDLGSYVEARLVDRAAVAFAERVRQWQAVLGERIVAHPPSDSDEAAVMLREAGALLEPLARLAASPLLPRSLGVSMHAVLAQVRTGARSALDDAWRRQVEEAREQAQADAGAREQAQADAGARRAVRTRAGPPRFETSRMVIRG